MISYTVKWWELSVMLTYRCNLACGNCLAGVSKFTYDDCNMTLEQLDRILNQFVTEKWELKRIFLTGGEPTLHPRLVEAIKLVQGYKSRIGFQICMQSNGIRVDPALQQAIFATGNWRVCNCGPLDMTDPAFDYVIDSEKYKAIPAHKTMYIAPVDVPELAGRDFSEGCGIIRDCPICVNKYGFYVCPPATIDKVLGLDLGVKNLQDFKARKDIQLQNFCKYCGEYKFYTGLPFKESTEWLLSPTWIELKKKYDAAPSVLTPF
jgi:hypothetical protein